MNERIDVLVADDHPIFRRGLRDVIKADPGLHLVAEVDDGRAAWEALTARRPHVAVLDVEMPHRSGLELARDARAAGLPTGIVVLTMFRDEAIFNAAIDAGVLGYVLKDNATGELLRAIRSAAAGQPYVSPSVTGWLMRRLSGHVTLRRESPGLEALTPTERRILRLIATDRTSKEIAADLGVSPRTVDNHRANISAKLGLQGSHSLLKFAFDNKARL